MSFCWGSRIVKTLSCLKYGKKGLGFHLEERQVLLGVQTFMSLQNLKEHSAHRIPNVAVAEEF